MSSLRRGLLVLAAVGLLLSGFARPAGEQPVASGPADHADRVSHFGPYVGREVIEVWVCAVPQGTRARIYHPVPLRVRIEPAVVAPGLDDHLARYFETLSNGRYVPHFVAGGRVELGAGAGARSCLAQALARSGPSATAVLAIADAEHRVGAPGGLGRPGAPCVTAPTPCPARDTGRGAYVGASDFHPEWGPLPAFDLMEHELGHTLGWPHSSSDEASYDNALDVMGDSTAPRAVSPGALHAGGTLGINRRTAGWIPARDVAEAPAGRARSTYELRSSASSAGLRLLVLPVAERRFLTVELRVPEGLDRHLPEAGIAITSVDTSRAVCGSPCDPLKRRHRELVGRPPYTDLLRATDDAWAGHGWQVTVVTVRDGTAVVEVQRSPSRRGTP